MQTVPYIFIDTDTLSDGSFAYSVRVVIDDDTIRFDAITLKDAVALASKFEAAITAHTNEEPRIY